MQAKADAGSAGQWGNGMDDDPPGDLEYESIPREGDPESTLCLQEKAFVEKPP